MNPKSIEQARNPELRKSLVALKRAAKRACEVALRTKTRLVIAPRRKVRARVAREARITVSQVNHQVNAIAGRLSLRLPQRRSLEILDRITEIVPPRRGADIQSDAERKMAIILEREALKWFKPAKGQFQLFYKLGAKQNEYQPDLSRRQRTRSSCWNPKPRTN